MRIAVLLGTLAVVAGCGGGGDVAPRAHAAKAPSVRCTHASGGFRACTVFSAPGERSALYRYSGSRWAVVRGPLPGEPGWWRRVFAAPDGQTLLAQWSGECEQQSTYLVSASDGGVRPIFPGHATAAVGWTAGGLARVRLSEQVWRGKKLLHRPGVYVFEPRTNAVTLERASSARPGC